MEEKGKKWLESEREGVGRLLLAARDLLPGEDNILIITTTVRESFIDFLICVQSVEYLDDGLTCAYVQVVYLNLGLVTARYLSQETATIMKMEQHSVNLGHFI